MLVCEGHKMFQGTMKIRYPYCKTPEIITATWLYKPELPQSKQEGYWYAQGRSFPAGICEIVDDLTKNELQAHRQTQQNNTI